MAARARPLILGAAVLSLLLLWIYNRWSGDGAVAPKPAAASKSKPNVTKPAKSSGAANKADTSAAEASKSGAPPVANGPLPDPTQFGFRGLIFQKLDLDGSGFLVEVEIPEARRADLMGRDTNADGRVDVAEFDAAIAELAPSEKVLAAPGRQVLLTPPPAGQSVPIYVPKQAQRGAAPEWFLARDKDQDGQLGLNEWPRSALADFDRLDGNRDGFVTLEEALAAQAASPPPPPNSPPETPPNG